MFIVLRVGEKKERKKSVNPALARRENEVGSVITWDGKWRVIDRLMGNAVSENPD